MTQKSLSALHVNSYFSENIENIFTCLNEIKEHILKHQKVFSCQLFYLCFLIVCVFFSFAPNWALLHHQLLCSGLLICCNNFFVFQLVIPSCSIYHPVWLLYSILWSCHCKLFAQMESYFFFRSALPHSRPCSSKAFGHAWVNGGKEWHNHKPEELNSSAQGEPSSGKSNIHFTRHRKPRRLILIQLLEKYFLKLFYDLYRQHKSSIIRS